MVQERQINAYLVSGLGADRRAFSRTKLPPGYRVHYIDWILPYRNESFEAYALRLSEGIDRTRPFVLVGLSFGGMLVSELSGLLSPRKTILISSASNRNELPWYFRLAGRLGIHRLLPSRLLKRTNVLIYKIIGTGTREEKAMLRGMLEDAEVSVFRWSVNAILTWKRTERPLNIFHIHGSRDLMLPQRYVNADLVVPGGKHFMLYSMAGEVNEAIAAALADKNQALPE